MEGDNKNNMVLNESLNSNIYHGKNNHQRNLKTLSSDIEYFVFEIEGLETQILMSTKDEGLYFWQLGANKEEQLYCDISFSMGHGSKVITFKSNTAIYNHLSFPIAVKFNYNLNIDQQLVKFLTLVSIIYFDIWQLMLVFRKMKQAKES